MDKFDFLYNELLEISKEILPYYDVDKVKPNSVYIWSKGIDGENVFDIFANEIVFYVKEHTIIEESKTIIEKLQSKLKEIKKCSQYEQ